MWSPRLFWKLFLGLAALHIAFAALFFFSFRRWTRQLVMEQAELRLTDTAETMRQQLQISIPNAPSAELQQLVEGIANRSNIRITLIADTGEIAADTREDPQKMENHGQRLEILQARKTGRGVQFRRSATLRQTMLYVALPVDENAASGFIRVSMGLREIDNQLSNVSRWIWILFACTGLLSVVLIYATVRNIIGPLEELTRNAEDLAAGQIESFSYDIKRSDELGVLSRTFEKMYRSLDARVDQLRESNERLAAVLGGMAEGVIAVDLEERVLLANQASSEMLGVSVDDPTGRFLVDVARFAPICHVVRQAMEVQTPQSDEFRLPRGGRRLAIRATPFDGASDFRTASDSGGPRASSGGVVLVMRDVTELRRLENMRSEFVANVSHELKSPLAAIQAYTETLQLGAIHDPENNLVFLGRIVEQADRLHQLILDLLLLARVESEQEVYDIVSVDVSEAVDQSVSDYRSEIEAKSLHLKLSPEGKDLRVRADQECFRTILDNLVGNAVKYTPEGGEITIRYLADDNDLLLEVIDTGIGIAHEHQQRVFERFYRADKARSREVGGTGLGLSIVKHLVQAFGGSVGVESESGEGARFFVRLPLVGS